VKRQALMDLQRAVTAAETRACDAVASERQRLERLLLDTTRSRGDVISLVSGGANIQPPHSNEPEVKQKILINLLTLL
jgi:hypothetical protein